MVCSTPIIREQLSFSFDTKENEQEIGTLHHQHFVLRSHFDDRFDSQFYHVFDMNLNPTEREDGNCDQLEACRSLTGLKG